MASESVGGMSRLKLLPPPVGLGGFMPAVGPGQPGARPRWPPIAHILLDGAPETRDANGVKQNQLAVIMWAPFPVAPWGQLPPAVFGAPHPPHLLLEGVCDPVDSIWPGGRSSPFP